MASFKYEQVSVQNTKLCIIETANFKPMIDTNRANGINVNITNKMLLLNIWNKKVDKIFIKVCPPLTGELSDNINFFCPGKKEKT
jgi:hypothetical protein